MAVNGAQDNSAVASISCNFSVHEFSAQIFDTEVYYQCLLMKDSWFIWIGSKPARMASLAMALPTPYNSMPLAVDCLPNCDTENISKSISQRLAKKCNKQIFVSCNLSHDSNVLTEVERRLYVEIKAHPQIF